MDLFTKEEKRIIISNREDYGNLYHLIELQNKYKFEQESANNEQSNWDSSWRTCRRTKRNK